MTTPWRETTLSIILSHYSSRDIYNADEFDIFYRALPTKIMYLKGEKYSGGKYSKIRLTGLATANMRGEKIMFVIGKSKKPRSFKGIRCTPCRYRARKVPCESENRTESLKSITLTFFHQIQHRVCNLWIKESFDH